MEHSEQGREPPMKRKKDVPSEKNKASCVIHFTSITHGTFKLFKDDANAPVKIDKLRHIKEQRLAEPVTSSYRMVEQCHLIPDEITDNHGYHWNCYKRFTGNLDRLQQSTSMATESSSGIRMHRRSSIEKDHVLFKPDCIFCRSEKKKAVKVKGSWTTQCLSQFQSDGWKSIPEMAEKKCDEQLLTRIRGHDLFACEAKFHKKCLVDYLQTPEKWRSKDDDARKTQESLVDAHIRAFDVVCSVITTRVLQLNEVLKLSELHKMYVECLAKTQHSNPNYRSENLKAKLIKHFNDQLVFCDMTTSGRFQSAIVFSSLLDVKTAVKQAFLLGSTDAIENVGKTLHHTIIDSCDNSPELKWPPIPQDLEQLSMPESLLKLLSFIISGKEIPTTPRVQRLVQSLGQDLCRAATHGTWKMPKHILMVMSLRHLFRSKALMNLLHRFGHCESYDFSLELETALAEAGEMSSSWLTNQIVRSPTSPSVFHSEFDNFDKLLNDMTGKGSIHTAHGIMLQDIVGNTDDDHAKSDLPSVPRSKKRALSLKHEPALPECYISLRRNPNLEVTQLTHPGGTQAMELFLKKNILWVHLRILGINQQTPVPAWSGFRSSTETAPQKLTTIDYYPVINHPITEYKTIQECLRASEEATKEVGQNYVITTFDLGVCMKAFPIIWQDPDRYRKHIILIGTFHIECAFMKMLGKKMKGSGLQDILLEAGLISSGSVAGVLTGKHYDRAIYCHKVMLEALEGLLIDEFTESHLFASLSIESRTKIDTLLSQPSSSSLSEVLEDADVTTVIDRYLDFKRTDLGKTAQLWQSYMVHVQILLALVESVKTNNYVLYAQTISQMSPLFFSFGGQNYARYLTYFSAFLANIDETHPGASDLIKQGAFSVARSFIPGNRCATDKTMEETFMRHAKSHGGAGEGVSGILTNYQAYQRWVRTTHLRSLYVNATLCMADLGDTTSNEYRHRDLRPAEIMRSHRKLQKTKDAISSFLNPFSIETKDQLIVLTSGAAAPDDIAADVLSADQKGKQARDKFIASRLQTRQDFFEPVKRLNLKTLEDTNKVVKMKASKSQAIRYKEQGTIAFKLLVKTQTEDIHLNMRELMSYPLTTLPFSIGTGKFQILDDHIYIVYINL